MPKWLLYTLLFFFLGCIFFIPLDFIFTTIQFRITNFFFDFPVKQLHILFTGTHPLLSDYSSDTVSLHLLLLLLFILSFFLGLLFSKNTHRLFMEIPVIMNYYLAFIFLKYGADKIFTLQFYTPQSNILYSPFGKLDRDILYWSTMGTSPLFSILTGSIEICCALLLLFSRTRFSGLLLAFILLVNIVLINFSFDISVKTFSLLLVCMVLFLLFPYRNIILSFLLQKPVAFPVVSSSKNTLFSGFRLFSVGSMLILVGFSVYDALPNGVPYEGAYTITSVMNKQDTLKKTPFPYSYFHIHNKSFFIFQDYTGNTEDFFISPLAKNQWLLKDYKHNSTLVFYKFSKKDSTFRVEINNLIIIGKPLPSGQLPALQNTIHWQVDKIR